MFSKRTTRPAGFELAPAGYQLGPVGEGDDTVQPGAATDEQGDEGSEDEGWPVLSDLEFDVCLSPGLLPGVARPATDPAKP